MSVELGLPHYGKYRVMRIFGPTRKEVEGGWRRLHSEELHNLYTSPLIRVNKCRGMRRTG
jgi:hypothetical protein